MGVFHQEKNDEKLRWRIASKKKNQSRGTPLYQELTSRHFDFVYLPFSFFTATSAMFPSFPLQRPLQTIPTLIFLDLFLLFLAPNHPARFRLEAVCPPLHPPTNRSLSSGAFMVWLLGDRLFSRSRILFLKCLPLFKFTFFASFRSCYIIEENRQL